VLTKGSSREAELQRLQQEEAPATPKPARRRRAALAVHSASETYRLSMAAAAPAREMVQGFMDSALGAAANAHDAARSQQRPHRGVRARPWRSQSLPSTKPAVPRVRGQQLSSNVLASCQT